MSEEKMIDAVQSALAHHGIEDELIAAGQFNPRGHTGGRFARGDRRRRGGRDRRRDRARPPARRSERLAGMHMADARSGLPEFMLIGVSEHAVYGFAGRSRSKEPSELAFQVLRDNLDVKIHQRANVRVVELIDKASGSRIELEGNRMPITHSKDVIDALTG